MGGGGVFSLVCLCRAVTQLVLVHVKLVRVRNSRIRVFEISVRNMREAGVRSSYGVYSRELCRGRLIYWLKIRQKQLKATTKQTKPDVLGHFQANNKYDVGLANRRVPECVIYTCF